MSGGENFILVGNSRVTVELTICYEPVTDMSSDGAFAVAGPASWNRLPALIQSSDTPQNFKNQLKAHFF